MMIDLRYAWRGHKARWRYERDELEAARRLIRPGTDVCDIGAHKGNYLYWMSKWASRVFAFEPQPHFAAYLRSVVHSNVTVEAKGVYSASGIMELAIPDGRPKEASFLKQDCTAQVIKTPVVTLDNYFQDNNDLSFLKIDVEGTELEVFRGADRILRKQKPALLFECESRHIRGDVSAVFNYLERLGYSGSFFTKSERLPVAKFRPEIHQRNDVDQFWLSPDYCNNFLFV